VLVRRLLLRQRLQLKLQLRLLLQRLLQSNHPYILEKKIAFL
jgi:hypothetical protein